MHLLLYTSVEHASFSPQELRAVLMKSRLRNQQANVTGMLLSNGGVFLQALEGKEQDVEATFDRISRDPRHADIKVLLRTNDVGAARIFGDWAMGFSDDSGTPMFLKGFVGLANESVSFSEMNSVAAMEVLMKAREVATTNYTRLPMHDDQTRAV